MIKTSFDKWNSWQINIISYSKDSHSEHSLDIMTIILRKESLPHLECHFPSLHFFLCLKDTLRISDRNGSSFEDNSNNQWLQRRSHYVYEVSTCNFNKKWNLIAMTVNWTGYLSLQHAILFWFIPKHNIDNLVVNFKLISQIDLSSFCHL